MPGFFFCPRRIRDNKPPARYAGRTAPSSSFPPQAAGKISQEVLTPPTGYGVMYGLPTGVGSYITPGQNARHQLEI